MQHPNAAEPAQTLALKSSRCRKNRPKVGRPGTRLLFNMTPGPGFVTNAGWQRTNAVRHSLFGGPGPASTFAA